MHNMQCGTSCASADADNKKLDKDRWCSNRRLLERKRPRAGTPEGSGVFRCFMPEVPQVSHQRLWTCFNTVQASAVYLICHAARLRCFLGELVGGCPFPSSWVPVLGVASLVKPSPAGRHSGGCR